MSEKIRVSLYRHNGPQRGTCVGAGETFEEAHAKAWLHWHQAFGDTKPSSVAIDPPEARSDARLRECRIAPLLYTQVASRVPADLGPLQEDPYEDSLDEDTLGYFEVIETTLLNIGKALSKSDLHAAREELRSHVFACLDLDAVLAEHQRHG